MTTTRWTVENIGRSFHIKQGAKYLAVTSFEEIAAQIVHEHNAHVSLVEIVE